MPEDISPKFLILTAEEEIIIPPLFQDTMGQNVGGMRANASELTQGSVIIKGIEERILMGSATAPLTGTGIFLGKDGSDYEFRAGNPSGQYIHWDGSTLTIVGTITATTGTIGGFDIGSDYIRDAANSMGLASTVTGGDDVRFWAGATFANRATAPFRVTEGGALFASSATLSGIVRFGGDGSDGALSITSGTTTVSASSADYLVKNYSSISITGTGVLAFSNPGTNGTLIALKSQGAVTLTSSATPMIDASGMGAVGGTGVNGNSAGNTGSLGNSIVVQTNFGTAGNNSADPTTTPGAASAASSAIVYILTSLGHLIRVSCGAGGGRGGSTGGTNASGAGGRGGTGLIIECFGALNFTTAFGISVA